MTKGFSFGFLAVLVMFQCAPSFAEKRPGDYSTLTFYLENDVFTGTDKEYTNGIKFTWISPDLTDYREKAYIPEWGCSIIDCLPFVSQPGFMRNISVSIGQNMYAPENLDRVDLIPDQRPYAGITYLALGLHSKNSRRMDTLEMNLGIVGPHSYAEEVQKKWHGWIDSADPKGWDNQLNDEPVLNIFYERKWKILKRDFGSDLAFDFIPHLGCSLGNALTAANFGGQVRFGWRLPNDFGTFLIRPGSESNAPVDADDPRLRPELERFGVHIFAGMDGRAVLRDIFLDGNTFRDSHSVDKKPFVVNTILGLGLLVHRFKISFAYVYQTKEYETQNEAQEYGAMTVSFSF